MNQNRGLSDRQAEGRGSLARRLALIAVASLGAVTVQAANPRVVITPAAGYSITWDGNNGGFFSGAVGAGPADNIALASHGTTPFTSSELGPALNISYHRAINLNDGLYGNNRSWIPNFIAGDPAPFAGLTFAVGVDVSSIAWSRDNGNTIADDCAGTCKDRCVGVYTLQYTFALGPDATTAETEDPTTGWATIGTVEYRPTPPDDIYFSAYLRHRFDVSAGGSPIYATGIRLKVPNANTDLDEIEVNPQPDPLLVEITPMPGFAVSWDGNDGDSSTPASPAPVPVNDASTNRGAVAFTSSDLGPVIGVAWHRALNLNDGFYGNSHSWIPNFIGGDPAPFAGLKFAQPLVLKNIAWGRDNGDAAEGSFTDRALGLYTLQFTTVPNPGVATPEACGPFPSLGWVTVATINYVGDDPARFNSYLRHRFDVSQSGRPLVATGIRLKVPNSSSAIDEIEVNANIALDNGAVLVTNAPGLSITWDGNEGQFYNPAAVAPAPPNRALASEGTIAFSSSELGVAWGLSQHFATNLNDGLYGNHQSWLSDFSRPDPDPFAGLNFGGTVLITNIAWGRDNGNTVADDCGGTCTDRALGGYRLQYTTVAAPDATTLETGDASTGWAELGMVTYAKDMPGFFRSYLRHRFDVSAAGQPIEATGLRIKVSNPGMDIDEIEVNTPLPTQAAAPLVLTPAPGYSIAWDGNEGQFYDPALMPPVPPNIALATEGTTAFTSSDLGPVWGTGVPYHRAFNLNDGLYGNTNSWISANGLGGVTDSNPFAGLNFNGTVSITNLAWSRDNGNLYDDCTAGTCTDRAVATYTVQVTTTLAPDATTPETDDPSTGWVTVATVQYTGASAGAFTPSLRHRFDLSAAGQPIDATGLRLKVSDGWTSIDEIEVNTLAGPQLSMARSGNQVVITWLGSGALEYAASVAGPWTCIPGAVSGYHETLSPDTLRLYRLHQ